MADIAPWFLASKHQIVSWQLNFNEYFTVDKEHHVLIHNAFSVQDIRFWNSNTCAKIFGLRLFSVTSPQYTMSGQLKASLITLAPFLGISKE